MLISIALILLVGLFLGWLCKKIRFPSLFGMIIGGIILGPFVLNAIDSKLLGASSELRQIALIIILIRAGLKLDLSELKRVGRPALLMCFLPASVEILGVVLIAPKLFGISIPDAAIIGSVIGAVSPAVIVPRMIKLIDEGWGADKGIPQMILAGASVDDVFVIVMFTTFTGLARGEGISAVSFLSIPVSIVLGVIAGSVCGWLLSKLFTLAHIRDTVKVIILFILSFALVWAEGILPVPFAALIAVMAAGAAIKRKKPELSARLSTRFDKLWVVAEISLFVLVGASVSIESAASAGVKAVILLLCALAFRMAGVFLCLIKTGLNFKERLFCMIAYTPKATVQAAIGGLPLAMGLECGQLVLTVSVIAILITAPLGAFGIDLSCRRFLTRGKK
ncbi:MAG: cation:proton antiporter [Oscillospiraceae bacterium]|nr:cation:proton antiporter [Oscillospiraceae bacterium]MBQ2057945.1 cation:proton antiporter [Oscillospiraceae bacterium]MBQ2330631.1 cation:proton antiporter [Oscillospiraceae bacterium]